MNLVNQEGFYHGIITDGGLSQSTNGFPQEVLALRADEVYDPDTDSYLPWDAENAEITWYGVLIDSKDKETKNSQQLKKIIDWDGASLVALAEMDLTDLPIAFRVEERTYQENTSLQVTWVDTIDAPPFRTVQKLDPQADKAVLAALQTRYAGVLASTKAAVAPVSAKTAAKAPTSKKPKTTRPKTSKKAPKPPKTPKTTVGKCTVDDAYNACYSLKRDDVTDDALNGVWLVEVGKISNDESKITAEQWFEIKEAVLKQVSKV